MKKYKELKNAMNRKCKKKEVFLNNICQDINEALNLGFMDKAYVMVKSCFGEQNVKPQVLKDQMVILCMKKQK